MLAKAVRDRCFEDWSKMYTTIDPEMMGNVFLLIGAIEVSKLFLYLVLDDGFDDGFDEQHSISGMCPPHPSSS